MNTEAALIAQLSDKELHVSQSNQPHATASMALTCARQMGYKIAGVPEEEKPSLQKSLAFAIGTFIHEHLQAAMKALHPDYRAEVRFDRGAVTGRADGLFQGDGGLTVHEIKTMSAKAYAWAQGHGPKPEHAMQSSIAALAFEAPLVQITYLAKEGSDSPLLEWTMPADLDGAAKEESRMQRIVANVVAGRPIPRQANGLLYNPATTNYPCTWCGYKARCIEDGE